MAFGERRKRRISTMLIVCTKLSLISFPWKKMGVDMQSYVGKHDSLIVDFDAVMPFIDSVDKHVK